MVDEIGGRRHAVPRVAAVERPGRRRTRRLMRGLVVTLGLALWPASIPAARLELLVGGLSSPLYATHGRDGSGRVFIVEQGGVIKVLGPGAGSPTVFVDISSRVLSPASGGGGEQGLLGLAFHPQFATNRRFFVNYTRTGDGATVIAEYLATSASPDTADPQSERVLLPPLAQPFANHNGGMLEFGPDGFLYIALGDGGSANDPGNRAQNTGDLLGKILRIDVDSGNPYGIPPDNPFASGGGRPEIFALGLRNPFRFSFDRLTGTLFAGDVGQGAREEIDIITRGGNYGWRVFEGSQCTGLDPALCDPNAFVPPITEYQTHTGGRCAVTGGYVYRGSAGTFPAGTYVFGDFCSGEIFLNTPATLFQDTSLSIASFGEDETGELYVVDLGGAVHRLIPDAGAPPPVGASVTAAVLPGSRSVQVNVPATAFATIINLGPGTATACRLSPGVGAPAATFAFQTTNPATNQVTGMPNTPVDIPANAAQSFVFAFTPGAPLDPTEVPLTFSCTNGTPAPTVPGLNTLLLSASDVPVPDIVAVAATVGNDGIVDVSPSTSTGAFAVALSNVGAGGSITVSADTGGANLPVTLTVCPTDPTTGQCLSGPGPASITQIGGGATGTFGAFVRASGDVLFDPATNRIFVRFRDALGVIRGSTSVAVRRQ